MEIAVPTLMDNEALPLEISKAVEKAERLSDRAVANAGYGSSDLGLVITKGNIRPLAEHIRTELSKQPTPRSAFEAFQPILQQLPPELLALCVLSSCIHGCAIGLNLSQELFVTVGRAISAECWAHGLTKHDPKLASRIEKRSRINHSRVKYRAQAARSVARKEGYEVKHWSRDRIATVGAWLVDCLTASLPEVFLWEREPSGEYRLHLQETALAKAEELLAEALSQRAVYLPMTQEPPRWIGWSQRHPDQRVAHSSTLLKTHYNDVASAVKAAIEDGSMQPVLDGVSTLQSVPWRINQRVLAIMQDCIERRVEVPGLPLPVDIPMPPRSKPWDQMTDLEQKQWKLAASEVRQTNRTLMCDRLLLAEDMQTAERLEYTRFWTPMNCDWRGRVYTQCHFGFQREDRVRALFEFAEGEPIGEDGIRWLKIHLANCGDFDKCSKKSLDERVAWVDDNMEMIRRTAEHPMYDIRWRQADKPFLFLAACCELSSALACGPTFVTHLPVSFDGSCSGLQHLAAMTRDHETAGLVNLSPTDAPRDVYSIVAAVAKDNIQSDENPLAPKFLSYGIDRKLCKRGTMTYFYGSKKFGMAAQQQSDLMEPLNRDVLRGKLEAHPFAPSHKGSLEVPGKAARYIASQVYDAVEETAKLPALAMKFMQGVAKTLAHEGKPVRWTTPTGLPWINRYHDVRMKKLRLYMHDRGVKVAIRTKVANGHEPTIAKDKAANSIAPNLVHACDAAHLILTVNAAAAEGITQLATVHDSFGCLASRATRFNEIIRAEFVRMYETHDVLSEVLEQAKCDLTQQHHNRLPMLPQAGTLNLENIKHAQYAFA